MLRRKGGIGQGRYSTYEERVHIKDAIEGKEALPDPTKWEVKHHIRKKSGGLDIPSHLICEVLDQEFIAKKVKRRGQQERYVSHKAITEARKENDKVWRMLAEAPTPNNFYYTP